MNYKIFFLAIFLMLISINSYSQLEGVKICIDPGHGGHNPANDRRIELTHGLIFWESEGNLMTALHERDLLVSLGANVKMTRTDNTDASDISLSSRSTIANQFGADYFHSNHTNAGSNGANYTLILFKGEDNTPAWPDAKVMGSIMSPNIQKVLETNKNHNRGDKSFLGFTLGVLRNTNMPATLSEGSFHDLIPEALRLKNTEYSKNYAWALAQSYCSYFNVAGFSTGRVGGIVTDRNTNEVINNVQVSCSPVNKTYLGDDFYNGFYAIGELAPGTYELTFSRSGYFDVTKTVVIQANKYIDVDVSLPVDNNGAPYVYFDIDGLPAGVMDILTFDASASADNGQIIKYEWDFGDGVVDTGKIVTHAFEADGDYIVSLTVTDDEQKTSTLNKPITIKTTPPDIPVLLSVEPINNNKGVKIKWKENTQTSLIGYRIYYASNPFVENAQLLADTNELKPGVTEFSVDSIDDSHIHSFWMTAMNIANQESSESDRYGTLDYPFDSNKRLLIVDGFHRRSSYQGASHTFASSSYLLGLFEALGHVDVSTCLNESIIGGKIDMLDYDIVIWFVGDESTVDQTFNAYEQNKVKDYLLAGGNLLVTGSEIAWDLDHKGTSTDQSFYHNFLKAEYVSDGTIGKAPAKGIGSIFDGVTLHYGEVYPEDYPDVIKGFDGAESIMEYNNGDIAGIAYKGDFGGTSDGAIVNIAFPLETVKSRTELKLFFKRLLQYFDITVGEPEIPICTNSLEINVFPTIVDNYINVVSMLDKDAAIRANVYDIKGNKIKSFSFLLKTADRRRFDMSGMVKGAYILQISSDKYVRSYKFIISGRR